VRERYLDRIRELTAHFAGPSIRSRWRSAPRPGNGGCAAGATGARRAVDFQGNLDKHYTFDNFVEGRSNQLGRAAALQVALNPGRDYNPLLLYGGTGLGKTHLMYAAGNLMRANNPGMRVLYLRSEQFFSAMMKSLQDKSMDQFKAPVPPGRRAADRRHPVSSPARTPPRKSSSTPSTRCSTASSRSS
jgi:chromosomal replication initiator protein